MGFMNEIGSLLKQYQGGSATSASGNVEQDFQQVTQQVPQSSVSSALSDVFRSNQTPPFGQMVSQMFGQSNGDQKAGILNHLIAAVGPGALAGSAFGGLSSLLQGGSSITPDQAHQVSPETVQNLAEHAEKHDPSIIDQASQFYAQHTTLVQGLGAGALAMMMSRMSQH